MKWLNDLVTGKDNATHDIGRWSWLICTMAVLAHDGYQLYHGAAVAVQDLAFALSAVAAAHGLAIGAKSKAEPGEKQP